MLLDMDVWLMDYKVQNCRFNIGTKSTYVNKHPYVSWQKCVGHIFKIELSDSLNM